MQRCLNITIAMVENIRGENCEVFGSRLILRAQLQPFSCILLNPGDFTSHSPLLLSISSNCQQSDSESVCVCKSVWVFVCLHACVCQEEQLSSVLMRTATDPAWILSSSASTTWTKYYSMLWYKYYRIHCSVFADFIRHSATLQWILFYLL